MRVSLRHALLAVVLIPACSSASQAEVPPPRASAVAVPTSSPAPTADAEEAPVPEAIDPASGENLAMTGAASVTVAVAGRTTTAVLTQSSQSDTVVEQNEGETERVLRLSTADPARPDDVQFSIEGVAAPGTFKTGEARLTVIFFDSPLNIDLLSDSGDCTVVLDQADASGARGTLACHDVATDAGQAELTATFTAQPAAQ